MSPTRSAVASYLDGSEELAFEVFFGDAFFGARLEGTPSAVEQFAQDCVAAFAQAAHGRAFFTALQAARNWTELGRTALFTEVGAVNAWRSIKSHKMPPPKQAIGDFDSLWSGIEQTALAADTTHKKALEFAYDNPVNHWFALPVNDRQATNRLGRTELMKALQAASG